MASDDLFSLFENPDDKRSFGEKQSLDSISTVESEQDFALRRANLINNVDLKVDYSSFENFVKFNSAFEYFTVTSDKLLNHYPIDGTVDNLQEFKDSLDGYQKYVLNSWPSRIGHLRFNPNVSSSFVKFDDVGYKDGSTRTSLLSPGTGSFSVQTWCEVSSLTGSNDVMVLFQKQSSVGDGYTLYLTGSTVRFQVKSGSSTNEVTASFSSVPTFVAGVCDRTAATGTLYILTGTIGSFPVVACSSTMGFSSRFDLGSSSFFIGSGSLTGKTVRPFTGSIDDLSVWSIPRLTAQLTSSYNRKVFAQTGLISAWRFNETNQISTSNPFSAIIKDSSGHRLDGRVQRYFQDIRGSGSFSYETPDPILTFDDANVLSYVVQQQTSGTVFDRSNQYKLTDLVPAKFIEDNNSGGAGLVKNFLYVMGYQYDQIKLFIDQLSNFLKVEYGDFDQTPDVLLDELGKFFGWNFDGSYSDISISKYISGRGILAGPDSNKDLDTKLFEIKNQIWKRTLLNLMHLYKMKGTRESVESLMRIYGLNRNIAKLKEYGTNLNEELIAQRIKTEKSTYSLYLGTGSLSSGSVTWSAGPISGSSGSVAMTQDFSVPFGSGFNRPTTPSELATSIGISTALATHIFPCDESSGLNLRDTVSSTSLTGSSGVAFLSSLGYGLPVPTTMSLTGANVAETVGQSNTNYFSAPSNSMLNYPSGSIAFLGVVKVSTCGDQTTRGLVGKGSTSFLDGYTIEMLPGGYIQLRFGDGSTAAVNAATNHVIGDGAWHYVAAIWDRTANLSRVITDKAASQTATIASVTGSTSTATPFRIGTAHAFLFTGGAQFAYLAVFTGSNAEALNNKTALDAWWNDRVSVPPTASDWTYTRASTVGSIVGSGSTGEMVNVFGTSRFAHAYGKNFVSDTNKLGALSHPAFSNFFTFSDISQTAGWGHSGSVTLAYGIDPRGVKNSVRVQKTGSGDRLTSAVQISAATQYCFSVFTKSTSSIPYLRVRNDASTTTMISGAFREDGTGLRADSGWHRIFLTYTPSSASLYRFEAFASHDGTAVGDAEFQYAQLNLGSVPLPLAFSIGSAATVAKTVIKKTIPEHIGNSLKRSMAMRFYAQSLIVSSSVTNDYGCVGSDGVQTRVRGYSVTSLNEPLSFVYNDAGTFVAQAIAGSGFTDRRTVIDHFSQFDENGIWGTNNKIRVLAGGLEGTSTTSISGISRPTTFYVGSRSNELEHGYITTQYTSLYNMIDDISLDDYSLEIRCRWPTTASDPAASVTSGTIWTMTNRNSVESLRWERNSLGSATGSLIFSLENNSALTMSNAVVFNDKWYTTAVVKNNASSSYILSVKGIEDHDVVFSSSSIFYSASISGYVTGSNPISSLTVGKKLQNLPEQWVDETRLWSKPLKDIELEDHVINFQSYGREKHLKNDDLMIHWRLNEGVSASNGRIYHTDISLNNRVGTGSYGASFPYEKFLNEYSFITSPEIGRTDESIFVYDGTKTSNEISSDHSRILSVEFNSIDALDEDISQMISSYDELNTLLGYPVNRFRGDYDGLSSMRKTYFKRLQGRLRFNVFTEMLDFFDRSFVSIIKKLIPARANFIGDEIAIESHMLERAKVQYEVRPVRDDIIEIEGSLSVFERDE